VDIEVQFGTGFPWKILGKKRTDIEAGIMIYGIRAYIDSFCCNNTRILADENFSLFTSEIV